VYEPANARFTTRFTRRWLGSAPMPTRLMFAVGVAQAAAALAARAGLVPRWVQLPLALAQVGVGAPLGWAARGETVPGATDNASGVAVLLALAEELRQHPLEHTEVRFVATGCEEALEQGALDYITRHEAEFDRADTYYLALDTLGTGRIHYATGEGLAARVPADPQLVSLAAQVADELPGPRAVPYAMTFCTDALPALVRGYKGMSIIALDEDGYADNYHWRTDTPEAVDPDALVRARDFTLALMRKLDQA
jgi:acetylornithine deacetylase/succinyl-diaminopimelate desuccinylase-like protein